VRILIIILFSIQFLNAQISETQGKDFWVSFPPNTHVFPNFEQTNTRDSLFIFFASNVPTDVRFTYWDYAGNEYKKTIKITSVLSYQTFGIPWYEFEIPAQDKFNHRFDNGIEYIQQKCSLAIHVESDEPIILLGHNQARWSSDGMLIYPTKTLGNRYIVGSYSSIVENDGNNSTFRASHFTIVATEDNTEITIVPTSPLQFTSTDEVNITLNKGEVYYARADRFGMKTDLTGTEVLATKPIAVFSGVERTYVPSDVENSRDYLVTQMSPFETSGIEYFVTPFVKNDTLGVYSKFRVIAYYDDTDIYLNDQYIQTLNKGEFIERNIDNAYYVRTSKTSYVYSIRRSSVGNGGFNSGETGDPFLLVNPPLQQYYTSYKVINFQAYERLITDKFEFDPDLGRNKLVSDTTYQEIYSDHYLTLILKEESIENTLLDFNSLPSNLEFTKIYNTDYVYTHIAVDIGTHIVSSSDKVLCFSYGYGYANSYGNVGGGLNMIILDHNAPELEKNNDCDNIKVNFTEINNFDSGLDSIMIIENSNIKISKTTFNDSSKTESVEFKLQDVYQDGKIVYRVYDEFGLYSSDTLEMAGFTLDLELLDPNFDPRGHKINNDLYLDYKINNYGKFPQEIIFANLQNAEIITTNLPQIINPNEEMYLTIKLDKSNFDINNQIDDYDFTFSLDHQCYLQKDYANSIPLWIDNSNPEYNTSDYYECDKIYSNIVIYDSSYIDYGIKEINLLKLENLSSNQTNNNSSNLEIRLNLQDIRKNGQYEIEVKDSLDNILNIEGIIYGLDVSIENDNQYIFENVEIDKSRCDDITIYNKSNIELKLDFNSFEENVNFSIPVSQFPILIKPFGNAYLQVCFEANINSNDFVDSLILNLNDCIQNKYNIEATIIETDKILNAKCDLKLSLKNTKSNNFNLSKPYPNPTNGIINIELENNKSQDIEVNIFNSLGENVFSSNSNLNIGLYDLEFDLSPLPSGIYFLRVSNSEIVLNNILNITK